MLHVYYITTGNDQDSTRSVNPAISVDPSNAIDKYFATGPHQQNVNIDILLSVLII